MRGVPVVCGKTLDSRRPGGWVGVHSLGEQRSNPSWTCPRRGRGGGNEGERTQRKTLNKSKGRIKIGNRLVVKNFCAEVLFV